MRVVPTDDIISARRTEAGQCLARSEKALNQFGKQTLALSTPWNEIDRCKKIMFDWATLSKINPGKSDNPEMNQKESANKLNKKN